MSQCVSLTGGRAGAVFLFGPSTETVEVREGSGAATPRDRGLLGGRRPAGLRLEGSAGRGPWGLRLGVRRAPPCVLMHRPPALACGQAAPLFSLLTRDYLGKTRFFYMERSRDCRRDEWKTCIVFEANGGTDRPLCTGTLGPSRLTASS